MAALSASTWGDPASTKHVLMLHGLTSSSQPWYCIAREFTSRGYFVTAPDLLGHGTARRGSNYTVAALAEELRPLFTGGNDHPYDIVIGHSLGGLVASALLPLLKSTRPVHVVLIDPPLELDPDTVATFRKIFCDEVGNPKTPEACLQQWPFCSWEDAILRSLSVHLCDVATVEAVLDQNSPWSFAHQLATVPDNIKVTVLVADPSKAPCARVEELQPYPHVVAKTVCGASHLIPLEVPQVVVETALEGAESPT